jgi:TolB protein
MKRVVLLLTAMVLAACFVVAMGTKVQPAGAAFPGENGQIAFVRDGAQGSHIFRISPSGTGLSKISTVPRFDSSPSWSADGKKIAFAGILKGNLDVYVVNTDGSGLKRITRSPARDTSPSWSPDGKRIAFARQRGEEGENSVCDSCIATIKLDGTGLKRLTGTNGFASDPAWSPNGEQIAFSKFVRGSGGDIFKMNAASGSQKKNLTNTRRAQESEPDWSPGGKKLAYTSFTEAQGAFDRVFTMNADGSSQTNLTGRVGGWSPAWSPDGNKIVFASANPDTPNFDIFVMKADGTGVERLTKSEAFDWEPDWQPLP